MGEKNGIPNTASGGPKLFTSLVGREERDSQLLTVNELALLESSWERRTGFPTDGAVDVLPQRV